MIHSHADPSGVACQVVYPARRSAPEFRYRKIMQANLFRMPFGRHSRPPFWKSATNSFFLVSTESHRLTEGEVAPDLVINVLTAPSHRRRSRQEVRSGFQQNRRSQRS